MVAEDEALSDLTPAPVHYPLPETGIQGLVLHQAGALLRTTGGYLPFPDKTDALPLTSS